jgi:hypothetical protein
LGNFGLGRFVHRGVQIFGRRFAWAQYPGIFSTKPGLAFNCRSIQTCLLRFLDVSLIHHQSPCRFGKQPKHPPKIGSFGSFFVDGESGGV